MTPPLKTKAATDEPVTMGFLDDHIDSPFDYADFSSLHRTRTNTSFRFGFQWVDFISLTAAADIEIIFVIDGIVVGSKWVE